MLGWRPTSRRQTMTGELFVVRHDRGDRGRRHLGDTSGARGARGCGRAPYRTGVPTRDDPVHRCDSSAARPLVCALIIGATVLTRVGLAVAAVALVGVLTGCAGLPPMHDRPATHAQPASTAGQLGRNIAAMTQQQPGLSGLVAVDDGRAAFGVRVALTRIAQRSIDIRPSSGAAMPPAPCCSTRCCRLPTAACGSGCCSTT
jgi:hypothetical protein